MLYSGTSLPPPCYIVMDDFTQHKKNGDMWHSTPFYSGRQGYKMRLKVYANGFGSGKGTHVSVYVQIIPGEYDDTLTWPYTGTVIFEIINWKEDSNHVKIIVDFSKESAIADGCGKKPTGEKSNIGRGHREALPHDELYDSENQYIHNDTLYIKISTCT